jgi:hypothetical protein
VCKIRLEKVDLEKESWWAAASQDSPTALSDLQDLAPPQVLDCTFCKKPSKEIFNAGWTCLEGTCSEFFKFPAGYVPIDLELEYSRAFMAERTPFIGTIPELVYPVLTEESRKSLGLLGYEKASRHGIVCSDCGCCIRRRWWDRWECENPQCKFVLHAPQESISIDCLLAAFQRDKGKKKLPSEFCWDQIQKMESICGAYNISTYSIPDGDGRVIGQICHFQADESINREKDGPDDLFREIQEGRLPLRRNPAKLEGSKFNFIYESL